MMQSSNTTKLIPKRKKKRSKTAYINALHGCKSCTARYYSALTSEMWTLSTRGHLLQLRNLVMAQGHLIMAPIFKLAHQHQSGSYLEELHDLRLCHPPWIKPFITRWHFCPVLNACTPWESDEASGTWRVMDNPLLCKGWQSVCCGGRGMGGGGPGRDFPAMPTASPGRCLRLSAASRPWSPSQPPSPEVADSLEERNHPRQMGPLTLAGPSKHCVLVTCHLLLFCGWNTSRQNLSVVGETQKKRRGWGKADIASLRSSSKFSERAGIKRRTRLRANKSRAPPPHTQKKAAMHPYGSPHHFSPYKTLWAPRRR